MNPGRFSAPRESLEIFLLCKRKIRSILSGLEGTPPEAVYLWGSIVRADFVPERSDIDALLLGREPGLEAVCRWLSSAVASSDPALCRFKARPLYREDFDGLPPRSELARLIHPRILLADFQKWQLVFGRRFVHEDFGLAPASLAEELTLRLEALRRRVILHGEDPEQEPARYILKEIMFICHALHQMREGPHPFSYPTLIAHADERTHEPLETLCALREDGWEEGACRRALGLTERFLALSLG